MKQLKFFLMPFFTCGFMGFSSLAKSAEVWKITSLEFPPHACQRKCPDHGATGKALTEALSTVDVKVEFHWLPWSRGINESKKGKFIGYYPAWPEDCQNGFRFSETIGRSPVGIAERTSSPLSLKQISDLARYKIGVVQDYGNTREINLMIKRGLLHPEIVINDEMNIKKLALGRIDGAFIDANMLKHFILYEFPEYKNLIRLNPMIIENKRLGICIRKSLWPSINATLKRAFTNVDPEKNSADYLKKHFSSNPKN